jgi:hypothetical protein
VGLRPGEKLFEEINCSYERMLPTYHEKIRIFEQAQPDWATISSWLTRLRILAGQRQEDAIVEHLQEIVPEYHPVPGSPELHRRLLPASGWSRSTSPSKSGLPSSRRGFQATGCTIW